MKYLIEKFDERDRWIIPELGDFISAGMFRYVFVCKKDPRWVIKVMKSEDRAANFRAFENMRLLRETEHRKWVPESLMIRDIIYMRRAEPITEEELPKIIPKCLHPQGIGHFGKINGEIVFLDFDDIKVNLI